MNLLQQNCTENSHRCKSNIVKLSSRYVPCLTKECQKVTFAHFSEKYVQIFWSFKFDLPLTVWSLLAGRNFLQEKKAAACKGGKHAIWRVDAKKCCITYIGKYLKQQSSNLNIFRPNDILLMVTFKAH